ncbi:divergent polysaccharide deacetylase family protein [Fuscovulum blasticum]|uniref:divergent polysaccharide deacetylase family protein n=1 Tax=Fuscovulum blasticum TaxID=1075 RepID=UPI000F4E11BE|nr:divergent polysaccharide deacetylase family protein [Fuscovulum blasticum]
MIGRFLQGAALGGLLGAALLAAASLTSPRPAGGPATAITPSAPPLPDTAALTESPAAEAPAATPPATPPQPSSKPAAQPAPPADLPAAPVPPAAADPGVPLPGTADPAAIAATPPAGPASPQAEVAPPAPDLPAPPPLTPEEEKMLADGAAPEPAPEPAPAGTDAPADTAPVGQGTLAPAPALPGAEGIATDRLPRIGDPAPSAADAALEDGPQPPVRAFARPFDNPAGKPVLAIILIDTGEPGLDRAALAALPFPVTFALDPMAEGAADRAATYRAAGQEVILLTTALPKGAVPSDVEQAFQVMGQTLPEAVAVMDLPGRSFQSDRTLAAAVVPVLGAQGRGLVTWDEGLNAVDQVARREDVPAAVIFRSLDAAGEPTPAIRRALDRAAFKAAQEGRVTVVGHTRPETVAALLEWAVEGRAATVALAPVTAVLTVD